MSKGFFSGRFQMLHDTEENWLKVANTFIPLESEPCLTTDGVDKDRVKYGDGIHTWGELEYSTPTPDSTQFDVVSGQFVLKGFDSAEQGQVPIKSGLGFSWVTPVEAQKLSINGVPVIPTEDGYVDVPIAGDTDLGLVRGSEEVSIDSEGSITIKKISPEKVEGLKQVLDTLSESDTVRKADLDQFSVVDGVLNLKSVDSSLVNYTSDETVKVALDDLKDAVTWKSF